MAKKPKTNADVLRPLGRWVLIKGPAPAAGPGMALFALEGVVVATGFSVLDTPIGATVRFRKSDVIPAAEGNERLVFVHMDDVLAVVEKAGGGK